MSKLDKNGKQGWTIGDGTVLRCPKAEAQVHSTEIKKSDVQKGLAGPANKKTRHNLFMEADQSEKQYQYKRGIEDR